MKLFQGDNMHLLPRMRIFLISFCAHIIRCPINNVFLGQAVKTLKIGKDLKKKKFETQILFCKYTVICKHDLSLGMMILLLNFVCVPIGFLRQVFVLKFCFGKLTIDCRNCLFSASFSWCSKLYQKSVVIVHV